MAIATIASQQAITASPVSAATAAMIGLLATHGIGLVQILLICVPSTLLAVVIAAFVQLRVGKELKDDPEYQRRLEAGEARAAVAAGHGHGGRRAAVETRRESQRVHLLRRRGAGRAGRDFPGAAHRPGRGRRTVGGRDADRHCHRHARGGGDHPDGHAAPVAEVPKCKTCQSGITAIIGILGLAWLGDTFITANQETIIGGLSSMAKAAPWTFAIGLFVASMLLYSQAATARALMPLGSLGTVFRDLGAKSATFGSHSIFGLRLNLTAALNVNLPNGAFGSDTHLWLPLELEEPEPLPLEAAHLVERQHLDALDVAEPGGELRRLRQVVQVVGQPRHQHEADPDRLAARREPARERERRARRPCPVSALWRAGSHVLMPSITRSMVSSSASLSLSP